MTQYDRILKHLQSKPITSMEAFDRYGITRLSAIIFNLRADGYEITSKMKKTKNCYGENCHFSEYRLEK